MKKIKMLLYVIIAAFAIIGFTGSASAKVCCHKETGKDLGIDLNTNDPSLAATNNSACYNAGGEPLDSCEKKYYCCSSTDGHDLGITVTKDPSTANACNAAGGTPKEKCERIQQIETTTDADKAIQNGNPCADADIRGLLQTVKGIYNLIRYITPVILIIMGSIDFMRATIAGKAEDMEKYKKVFFNRLFLAAIVFLLLSVFEFITNILSSSGVADADSWVSCWSGLMIMK